MGWYFQYRRRGNSVKGLGESAFQLTRFCVVLQGFAVQTAHF
jgi:hypothetical protein